MVPVEEQVDPKVLERGAEPTDVAVVTVLGLKLDRDPDSAGSLS